MPVVLAGSDRVESVAGAEHPRRASRKWKEGPRLADRFDRICDCVQLGFDLLKGPSLKSQLTQAFEDIIKFTGVLGVEKGGRLDRMRRQDFEVAAERLHLFNKLRKVLALSLGSGTKAPDRQRAPPLDKSLEGV